MAQDGSARRRGAGRGHGALPDAKRDAVMVSLLRGLSCEAAGLANDVNGRTVREWMQTDAAFRAEYDERRAAINARSDEALANARTVAVDTLVALSLAGDGQAAAALLRATTAAKHEHSGPGGGPIPTAAIPKTRAEVLAELRAVREQIDRELSKGET